METGLQAAALRHRLGMSQTEFAAAYGVAYGTVRRWETSADLPPHAQLLLRAVERDPETMQRLLAP